MWIVPPHLHRGKLIFPCPPTLPYKKVMVIKTQPLFIVNSTPSPLLFCCCCLIVSLFSKHFAFCHQICLSKMPLVHWSLLHCSPAESSPQSHPQTACTQKLTTSDLLLLFSVSIQFFLLAQCSSDCLQPYLLQAPLCCGSPCSLNFLPSTLIQSYPLFALATKYLTP